MAKGSIEWEHTPEEGLVLRIKPGLCELLNEEVCKRAITSRKDMLLAFRGLIDAAVKRLEEKEKKTEAHSTKIEVE